MLGALLYLRLTSAKNLVLTRLRRLRQPKYLIGAIVGVAYFYFIVFGRAFSHGGGRHAGPPPLPLPGAGGAPLPHEAAPLALALAALALLVVLVVIWTVPSQKPGLAFSEAETAFLFPAPISRRSLIHFKLLGTQFTVLLQSLFFALIFNHRGFTSGRALNVLVGWWVVLTFVNLHYMGASFVISRLVDRGTSALRRRLAVLGGIALVVAVTIAWIWRDLRAPTDAELAGFDGLLRWLLSILDGGLLHWLLLPLKWVLAPFFAAGPAAFFLALGPALALLAAHYFWVVNMQVSFEEASIAQAEKRAARRAALRSGQRHTLPAGAKARRPPFALARTGRAEIAFLWKNLLSTHPLFGPRTWLVGAVVIVAGTRLVAQLGPVAKQIVSGLGVAAVMLAGYTLVFGPLVARLDLRRDLANADLLKTYPLPGWRIVLGELLAPTALLTGVVTLGLLAALCAFDPPAHASAWLAPHLRVAYAVCLALLAPPLLALQLLVPNAAAVLFPAWFQAMRTPTGGIDLMGQRLIFAFGQIFVILLALLPAALTAALLVFVTQWLVGPLLSVAFATVAVLLVLLGEVWCGVWWLGERFERFDLSADARP